MGNLQSAPYQKHIEPSVRMRSKISRYHEHFPSYSIADRSSRSGLRYPHAEDPGPILFHDNHGLNVTLSEERRVASRTNSFYCAIVLTSRPINVEERLRVRLRRVEKGWSGVMRFGFTTKDPSMLQPDDTDVYRQYVCPILTNEPGYWTKAIPVRFATENNILEFYVSTAGCVFFAINNELKGMVLKGVDVSKPIWGIFDIYGITTSLELISHDEIEPISLRQSLELEIGLPEGPVQLPANMQRSAKIRLQIREQITPICFSATMGSGLKCRNRIHLTRKDGIIKSTVAFTNTALRSGQTAYFYCAEERENAISHMELTRFGIGVTTCDPTSIPIPELPFDSMLLMDRPEYWVFFRDFEAPEQGEYFALSIEKGGYLSYNRSKVGKTILFHMDTSQPLYIVIDLCGNVSSVATVGMGTEPNLFGEAEATTSGDAPLPLFDFASSGPVESFNFFTTGSLLNTSVVQHDDAEMVFPVTNVQATASNQGDEDKAIHSGIYPQEPDQSRGVSASTMAAVAVTATPIVESVLSWIGQRDPIMHPGSDSGIMDRTANRLGSNNEAFEIAENISSPEPSSDESDGEVDNEAFYNATEEQDSSSSSDDLTLETQLRNNTTLLEMLSGDLEEILGPLGLTAQGAVGGALPARADDEASSLTEKVDLTTKTDSKTGPKKTDSGVGRSAKECVICFDNTVNAVIYACGHVCLCYDCGIVLLKQRRPSCPVCRARVEDVIRIYQA